MSEKRKDAKGHVLRAGESRRKNLIYQYRYTDFRWKRQTIYSSDLKELREKEKAIQKLLNDGIDYAAGRAAVILLLERYIELKQGVRFIPMTDDVCQSLKNILARRKKVKVETIVDGYSGFILVDKNSKPKVALHIENEMRWAIRKCSKLHPDQPLPSITSHVFRHTFCTDMANAGMDVKTLQYLMGHSDAGVTLNIYTHTSYDRAAEQMAKLIDFRDAAGWET